MSKRQHTGDNNDDMILKPDLNVTFEHKSSLLRSEETGVTLEDEKAIAMLEGDAGMEGGDAKLSMLFAKTKLQPDTSIVYPDTTSLKKRIIIVPLAARYAAAAIIILMISLGIWTVFSPEAISERNQYELAKLERISKGLDNPYQQISALSYRTIEGMIKSPAQRENLQFSRIETNQADRIALATISHTNPVLAQRPIINPIPVSSIQYPVSSIQYPVSSNDQLALNEEPKKKTLVGKIFSGIFGRAKAPFENNDLAQEDKSNRGFSLWNIAELGMKGVNAMGDHDYTVVRDYNEKGNVKGLIVLEE